MYELGPVLETGTPEDVDFAGFAWAVELPALRLSLSAPVRQQAPLPLASQQKWGAARSSGR